MPLHREVKQSGALVLNVSGQVPTLPNPLSLLKGSNGWRYTDLSEGESCINKPDNLFYIRINNTILSMTIGKASVNSYFPAGW